MPNNTATSNLGDLKSAGAAYAEQARNRVDFRGTKPNSQIAQDSSGRMPELNLQPDNALRWFSEPGACGTMPPPVLLNWLTDPGLLTARLRQQCGADFRLEVIEAIAHQPPAGPHEELRRIVLWCGDQPCIYAETLLPEPTTAAHPWLKELGNEPLGETLQTRSDVSRSGFEYALLAPAQMPFTLSGQNDADLWARRSSFFVGGTSLLVTEIFLPGVLECTVRRARTVDQN